MINKPTILISSLGRTGTSFWAEYYRRYFPDSFAWHEPGTVNLRKIPDKIFWKSLLHRQNIKKLSKLRMLGRIGKKEAAKKIARMRQETIEACGKSLYIESNHQFQGLFDILPMVFKYYRAVYLVRDPRDSVRSFINQRGLYHKFDIHSLAGSRVTAVESGGKNPLEWKKMDQFEKLCWAWNFINSYALESIAGDNNCRWLRFEDVFVSKDRNKNIFELNNWLITINKNVLAKQNPEKFTAEFLKRKINKTNKRKFPGWEKWPAGQAKTLQKYCGVLMERLGYGQEPEWRDLTG